MNIGLFDSGIGGLTVLKACMRAMPNYTYVYYGDNANAPYGEKSMGEIYDLTIKGIEFLFAKNCSLVVLACNTASTVLPRVQQEWLPKHYPDRKVLGIIRPTAEHIMQSSENEIYLMATPATVNAHSYEKELKKLDSKLNINPIPCPGLAKAIEDSGGKINSEIKKLLEKYLNESQTTSPSGYSSFAFKEESQKQKELPSYAPRAQKEGVVDQPWAGRRGGFPLYLACTHYEWVEEEITRISGCKVVHQSQLCAKSLGDYLFRHKEVVSSSTAGYELFFSKESSFVFE